MFQFVKSLFHVDHLSWIMLSLIAFIGVCMGSFASRFMKGDSHYRRFFVYLAGLIASLAIMVTADHIALFFAGWCLSNFLLVRLMVHKGSWRAAKNSGRLALKNHLIGALSVGAALLTLFFATSETSIYALNHMPYAIPFILPVLVLLFIGAMTQSAIWPFHKWLLSSLNSPTPVSAIMHAGLINGGGFLLIRFGKLYFGHTSVLSGIFLVGMVTALIGTFWKLMQNDVKRMLACSTMGQMGFMIAQCGLGLFPAALAHLVTHGMYKAYLFLASGGAAQEKRHDLTISVKGSTLLSSLLCGVIGSLCFSLTSGKSWLSNNSTLVLMVIVLLAGSQAALPILSMKRRNKLWTAMCVTSLLGLIYGATMAFMAKLIAPMQLMHPQPLNAFHILGIALLTLSWGAMVAAKGRSKWHTHSPWKLKGYVRALNASQPHPDTVTPLRNQYNYL